jgi:dienelactone hydrolase
MLKSMRLLICAGLLSLMMGCTKKQQTAPAARGQLLEHTLNGQLSRTEVVDRITELDGNTIARYDVKFYSITYRTEYQGKPVDTRGLLIIPELGDTVRLLMYCHGTELPSKLIGADKVTPSLYKGSRDTHNDVRNMGLGWASAGYVVFIPDYIGFGLTLGKDHPYIYFPELFKANIDGLLASRTLIAQKGLLYNDQLFIAGWSQGGGACLSAHKYIQENYSSDFRVKASSSLAGLTNVVLFTADMMKKQNENIAVLPILSWGIYTINKFSALKRPTDQIYTYPVFDQMSSILTPSSKPSEVFSQVFLNGITNGSDTEFSRTLSENSFHQGWRPVGKVFLHHGDADNIVPYAVSESVREGLTAAGADITLYTYPGGGHASELGPFIKNTLADFNLLK